MVLYQAIRQNPHINTVQSLLQHSLERCVIFWLFKDGRTSIGSIENMKNHSTIISSFGSPHNDRRLPAKDVRCQITVPDTFSLPEPLPKPTEMVPVTSTNAETLKLPVTPTKPSNDCIA